MSGFDEEAERERLREKYERDQEKRAATQRMSELLLKGATMTNSHCDACGDPIFRHDGQEFCPTCHAAESAPAEVETESGGDADADGPGTAADADADASVGSNATPRSAPGSAARPTGRSPSARDDAPTGGQGPERGGRGHDSTPRRSIRDDGAEAGGSVADARASLSRTLVRYAEAAEGTDDPRRATEFLSAAREAAEALAALDRR